MRYTFIALLMVLTTQTLHAAAKVDVDTLMTDHQWQHRVLLVFSPDSEDERLLAQNASLTAQQPGMTERDLVVWRITADGQVSRDQMRQQGAHHLDFYQRFNAARTQFTAVLIGKDGQEKMRRHSPVSASTLFQRIDSMPMRQREMRRTQKSHDPNESS